MDRLQSESEFFSGIIHVWCLISLIFKDFTFVFLVWLPIHVKSVSKVLGQIPKPAAPTLQEDLSQDL